MIGRFISPDSVDYLDPTSINGLNLYAYCNNDSVNMCDPSGHSPEKWISAILVIGLAACAIFTIVASCGAASAAIAPILCAYFGIAANTTLAITTGVAVGVSIGIGAFALADVQSIITDGKENYLSFLGDAYQPIKQGLYFTSYAYSEISQYAVPGWGKQTVGKKDAPSTGNLYGSYTKVVTRTENGISVYKYDTTVYNGNGQAIYRYDYSHPHNGMEPHLHTFKWWIYGGKWRWDGKTGSVSNI